MAILEMRKRLRHLAGLEESMRRDAAKLEALQARMSHSTVAKDLEAYLKARHVDGVEDEDEKESLQEVPLDSMTKFALHDRPMGSQSLTDHATRQPSQASVESSARRGYTSRAMRLVDLETGDGMAFPVWGIPDPAWQPEFSVSTKGGLLAEDILPNLPPSKEVSTLAARYESAISALRQAIDTPKVKRAQAVQSERSTSERHDRSSLQSGLEYQRVELLPSERPRPARGTHRSYEDTSHTIHVDQSVPDSQEELPPDEMMQMQTEVIEMHSKEDGQCDDGEQPNLQAGELRDVWLQTYNSSKEFARQAVEVAFGALDDEPPQLPEQTSWEPQWESRSEANVAAFATSPVEVVQAFDDELLHSVATVTATAAPAAVAGEQLLSNTTPATTRALAAYDEAEGRVAASSPPIASSPPMSNLAAAVKGEAARQRERLGCSSERHADARLLPRDEAHIVSPRGAAQPLAASSRSQQSVETVVFPRHAAETTPLELHRISPIPSSRDCAIETPQSSIEKAHIAAVPSPVAAAASDEGSDRRKNIMNRFSPEEVCSGHPLPCFLQQQVDPGRTVALLPSRSSAELAPCGGVAAHMHHSATVQAVAPAAVATHEAHYARMSLIQMPADAGAAAHQVPCGPPGPTPSATVTTMTATPAERLSPAPSQQNSRGGYPFQLSDGGSSTWQGSSSIVVAASEVISRGGDAASGVSTTPSALQASRASSLQQSFLVSARLFMDDMEQSEPSRKPQVVPMRRPSSTSRQVEFAESVEKASTASAGSVVSARPRALPPTPGSLQRRFAASAWLESSPDVVSSHAWDTVVAESSSQIAAMSDASDRIRSSALLDLTARPMETTRSPSFRRSRSLGGNKRMTINVTFR